MKTTTHQLQGLRKSIMMTMMMLMLPLAVGAQDACYLVGTDGNKEDKHASATLERKTDGVFSGEVTFSEDGREFFIATILSRWDDINKVGGYCYGPITEGIIIPGEAQGFAEWNVVGPWRYFRAEEMTMGGGGSAGIEFGKPYTVTVDFNQRTILVAEPNGDDPGSGPTAEDDGTTPAPDLDLTKGAHFSINLAEPNTLQRRLEGAVFQTDYDMVDFLTVKGKFGGKDLVYLRAQEGLVSQLQYLDLSQVELVYDDEPYHQVTTHDGGDLPIGIVNYHTTIYTFSAENKTEGGPSGGFTGTSTSASTYVRCNDLSYAFMGMKHLKQIKLPKTLKGLGAGILMNCEVLEKVTFPDAPTYIGDYALMNETGGYFSELRRTLKGVDLPVTVDSLGTDALRGVGFRTIDVSRIKKLGDGCLRETNIKEVSLHPEVKSLSAGMFSNCKYLQSVTIPATIETIGDDAFNSCENLSSVTFAGQVERIGNGAFSGCKKLTTVRISAKEIGESAFAWCNLTTVEIADGTRVIGAFAFNNNRNLTHVATPNTLEEIGSHAFQGYGEYGVGVYETPYIINLPVEDGVKYVGSVAYLYMGGDNLRIKEGTLGVADAFLDNQWYLYDGSNSWGATSAYIGWKAPTTITLPTTLRFLGSKCFYNAGISSIALPESLEKIGDRAFMHDKDGSKLRRVTIPKNVKYIGSEAFKGTALIRVNYDAIDADVWKDIHDNGDVLYNCDIFPKSVVRVIIGEGVKTIPPGLFDQLSNIARVEMASTVERIGDYAFNACTSLSHIDLPSALKHLGKYSLSCGNLASVTAYMQQPQALIHPDFSDLDPNVAISGSGYSSMEGPFGSTGYSYTGDNGTINWEASAGGRQIPLLKVPNGLLAAYAGEKTWAAQFQKIEQFDGASSADIIKQSLTVSVSETVTDDTDLTGTMMGSVFVTLDTEDSGDGYNATEGCLVINSTVSEEALAVATADDADDLTVKNRFNGLIFEVPAGKGTVSIDCQTLGQNIIYVKTGDAAPQPLSANSREKMTVGYEVGRTTRIFVYANKAATAAAALAADGDRRAAYANDDAVKIYGLTVNIDEITSNKPGDVNGDGIVNAKDIVETTNAIMGKPSARFDATAADVNGDGTVNVADIISIVKGLQQGQ